MDMYGKTPILTRVAERIVPNKSDRPCEGHKLKYYLKGMCSNHVYDCPNITGCSHDCRGCSNIRWSRHDSEYRVREEMIRRATTKIYKARGEDKRNELRDRFEKLQAKKVEVARIKREAAERAKSGKSAGIGGSAEVGLSKPMKDDQAENGQAAAERAMYEPAGLHRFERQEETHDERSESLYFGTGYDIERHRKLASAGLTERADDESESGYEADNEKGKAVRYRSNVS